MPYPVSNYWIVSGTLNKNGIPFYEGKVYADNLKNGVFQTIAETGISSDGSFTLGFSSSQFQNGDTTLEYPTLRIRVEDYQQNTLWTSNIYNEPSAVLNVGPIDISKHPDQNGDCRVFGTAKNEQGDILANIKIIAYCLHFVDKSVDGEDPSGSFEKIILGEMSSASDGQYEIRYSSTLLPAGLLLDSKEDYGKDKVSLYAEAYEKKGGKYYHKSTEHLVFNGKTEQEINFTLKSQQASFECEYAKLDSMLRVYRNSVDSWCTAPVNNTKKINAINTFLNSNTVFPLVAGRERIVDSKVHAYFTAYSMLLQLQKRELDGYSNFTAEEENCWLEIFFALALRESVSTLYKLTKAKPTIIQKTLFGAVSDGLICPTDTTLVLNLWKTLVNGGTLRGEEDDDKNDALTISQLLSLYIKEDLTIEYPSTESESSTGDDSESEEKAKELPHYVAVENFDSEDSTSEGEDPDNDGEGNNNENPLEEDNQQETQEPESAQNLYEKLLDAYYSVGADVDAFIELLQENALVENNEQAEGDASSELYAGENEADSNDEELDIQIESDENILLPQEIVVPQLTQEEISRLKAVFDLNEFFEKFAPGIVCTYRYVTRKENFDFCKLSDLLRLADTDWKNIVNAIAEEYYVLYCYESEEDDDDDNADDEQTEQEPNSGETPQNNNEPENTPVETTETIPPCALPPEFPGSNVNLKKIVYARKLSEQIIAWFPQQALLWGLKDRLEDQEWGDTCDLLMSPAWEDFSLSDTDLDEYIGDSTVSAKEKIQQLQRLYHLTESAEAIAYLINHGFKSAYQISTMSENEFVAKHGNGIGKVAEARQIHRLAQNYMAEASLNIQAYVTSSVEEPAEEPEEEYPVPENRDGQQNVTLRAIPRALPKTRMLRATDPELNTNTARVREATRNTINWAGLFGNINFTKATQGQSILSASAYYVDLLKFLKKSTAYSAFTKRRPDYLGLQLTKANAEIPMPTIDLGIELLECLVNDGLDKNGKACVVANNNPVDATAALLRAEPLEFKDGEGKSIDDAAALLLARKIYPFQLPANFSRDKARKILSNLSLHFYDIPKLQHANAESTSDCRELRLDFNQRCLMDSNLDCGQFSTWDMWGLKEHGNEIILPDKNSTTTGNYIGVLRRVAVFLQRTGFTIHDLNEILNNGNFDDVRYRPKDSEFYQLANINGYEFVPRMVVVNEEEVPVNVDWDFFFKKMAVLVHRKNILGWSLSDVLLTFDLSLEELDVVCELVGRYNVSVQDAMVLGCKQEATTEFINSVYQLPGLLVSMSGDDEYRRTALKLLVEGLGLSEEDSENIYDTISVGDDDSLLQVLYECYRYSLIAKSFGISVPNLGRIVEYGAWTDDHTLESIRELSDEWRILSGTSVDAEFYLDLLAPIGEDEESAANQFALNLASSGLGDKPTPGSQNYGPNATFNTYEDALDAWHDNLKLLICAEFGLVKGQGEELLPDGWPPEMDGWEDFYADAKQYDEIVHPKGETRTGTVETPRLPTESYELYVTLLRKVAVYNFIQKTQQGIDLTTVDFLNAAESDSGKYGVIRPLIVANYVTDRLLSGDFDIDRLVEGEDLENLLAVGSDVIGALKEASFEDPVECTSFDGWLTFTRYYELYAKTHLLPTDLDGLLAEIDLVPGSDDYDENIGAALSSYTASVKTLEDAVRANTRESEWLKFAQEMNDDLRRRKRDALAAYVCWDSCILPNKDYEKNSRYPRKFVDENDIYGYYLMDVKMEPDMTISRIVQASASIQLFVQRAELGLEGENVLTDEQRSEWEWMKNYRVWEAARKVFLYPENWIASDLRDDKTPFFEELEERIQEFSDDHKNLEDALFEYLEKVREVSSIEIVGATKEDGGDEGGILYTLHIIGRTRGEPHAYYYRKYKAKATLSGEWTPWERLDVDIPSETVVPAVVNQRLYLLWPQVTMGQRSMDAASDGGMENIEYYARIRICWTSYTGTKWTGTRMTCNALYDTSSNQLDFALGDNEAIDDRYSLKTESSLDWVKVSIVKTAYKYQEYEEIVGTTEVMDGSTKINKVTKRVYDKSRQFYRCLASIIIKNDGSDTIEFLDSDYLPIDDYAPERTQLVHGVFMEVPEFTCGNKGLLYPEDNAVLNYTPGLFRIVATNLSMLQLDRNDKVEDLPFFYMDDRRTFFVQAVPKDGDVNSGQKNYRFELLSHSLVDDFYKRYRDGGTKWLYTRETQALPISDSYYYSYSYYNYYFSVYLGYYMAGDWQAWDLGQTIFRYNYWPNKANVDGPYPAPMVDFVWGGANAMYNWELFFYVPMLIAEKMIAEQSYEEALLWLQLVFDPRENYSAYERTKHFIHLLPKGARYWKFLPFFANKDADKSILQMLGMPTKRDKLPDRTALSSLADKWKNDPFNPHLIARYRNVAYQKYVVMKYLDTLIGWGDREFAKDTTESVNLAIQFYVLAAELLGPKSPEAPEPDAASPLTAKELLSRTDDLGNAFIEYENAALVGKGRAKALLIRSMDARTRRTGNIVESMFYFSIPRNETLFSYWDTIADRLYKIRNSLNIQGVKRALALFAPPIDPGLMVKAQAMGLSIDSILNSVDAKLPIYRFRVIVKLAVDMAKDACQMGRDLLGILEKQDAEQLQVFKAKCDKAVVAETRAVHEMKVKSLEVEKTKIEEKKATKQNVTKQQKAMHLVSRGEEMYQKAMEKVARIQEIVEKVRNIASATYKMPDFKYGSVINAFGGPRFDIESLGGTKLAENLISAAESYAARFAQRQLDAAKTKLQAELERRKKEWLVEDEVADAEVAEIEKEEVVNEIKVQQVEKEQKNIEREILRSEEIYDVLSEKFTNNDLYIWLEKELGKVFRQYVKTLLEIAQMAEKAYHFEIEGDSTKPSEFMAGDYWETFYKGLLAPERILLDLRRMEKAYLENDVHEMKITRPIRLSELEENAGLYECESAYTNPLTQLKGRNQEGNLSSQGNDQNSSDSTFCEFQLTKKFFEKEFNNHFFQRIRNVQIVVETSDLTKDFLNAELTLTSSKIWVGTSYNEDWSSDTFASSMSNADVGMYSLEVPDEKRFLFEGRGAVSTWRLEIRGLPKDYETEKYPINDVIVYLTYTSRKDG